MAVHSEVEDTRFQVSILHRCSSNSSNNSNTAPASISKQSTVSVGVPLRNELFTIADVKARIVGELSDFDGKINDIRVVFAGKSLDDATMVSELDLGPSTRVHAIVCESNNNKRQQATGDNNKLQQTIGVRDLSSSSFQSQTADARTARFFVYCKGACGCVRAGKLRVRCFTCKSTAVELNQEPSCWNDVLTLKHIRALCLENECDGAYAEFYLRCSVCSQKEDSDSIAIALPQVCANVGERADECCICDEVPSVGVLFVCPESPSHLCCLECFVEYAKVSLEQRRFRLHDEFGYTLDCPVRGCGGLVEEAHLFRLMGDDTYNQYQRQATEMSILGQRGLFCPRVDCAAGFTVDRADGEALVVCPECEHPFCRECRMTPSECCCTPEGGGSTSETQHISENAAEIDLNDTSDSSSSTQTLQRRSLRTISITCKRCPVCGVATERSGGCAHMQCQLCGAEWCWLCLHRWTDQCQWDHWFDW